MSREPERVEVDDVKYISETPSAILFETSQEAEVWIPKSLCEWDPDSKTLSIDDWKAEELGLI